MRDDIEIGLLYSRSGDYVGMSESCRAGALAAIDEVNADPDAAITLIPVERDPGGDVDLYQPLCSELLRTSGVRHIFGCITSWSRKEVIPALEKDDGILWYACPYEGFEASDRVVYAHACPNQHLLPLLYWAIPRFGRRVYLTGSNYIWGWEMNRVAREVVNAAGGEIAGERYLPLGEPGVERLVAEIRESRPAFIVNNLIGASSHAFLRALAALGREDARFSPVRCPVLSCNLTEAELGPLGDASEGLIAAGPYFHGAAGWLDGTLSSPANSFAASAHVAVRALVALLSARPQEAGLPLPQLLRDPAAAAFAIDPKTHHMTLPVLIAQVRQGAFEVVESLGLTAADPYLARRERWPAASRPPLAVVR